MVEFTCDYQQPAQEFDHFWEHTIGSGYAPLSLRADWQAQLSRCRRELGFRHVRFHGILSDFMGILVEHADKPLYSFFNADQFADFALSIGIRPFVELSFMPQILASGEETVFSYQGNITPPKDYDQWGSFINRFVGHWVDRYGLDEVKNWYFEVWNEANLHHFWTGDQAQYFKLYRHTVEAIKKIDPSLRVGGPATAQNEWIPELREFCEKNDLPLDFLTTHHYPTDPFGEVDAPTEEKLAQSDRDVMRQQATEARQQAGDLPLYYTEWNIDSNPRHYFHDVPFAASFATRIIMSVQGLVDGYSWWTFSDIFEENYFPSTPFHGGFGLLTLHGIPKPAYRAFEMLHHLGTEQLTVAGSHQTAAAWAVRKPEANEATVLMINQERPKHPIYTETLTIRLQNTPQPERAFIQRIDEQHANARPYWLEMGEPEYLDQYQVEQLMVASRLHKEPFAYDYEEGSLTLTVSIPPQGMAAVTIEFQVEEQGEEEE
jgi:xylan 1,4-beta-xylosidase